MSTSNQQRSSGRRQPFGFLNANTIPSAKSAGSLAASGDKGGAAATDGHKKQFKGVLSSIVKLKQGKKKERSRGGSSSSLSVSSDEEVKILSESPSKKTPVMKREEKADDSKPVTPNDAAAETTLAGPKRQAPSESHHSEFAASDVAGVFRSRPDEVDAETDFYWDDGMEDMLELKQANPILDESLDCVEEETSEGRIDPSNNLAKELEESASGEPISWSNRVQEDEDGFKIHLDDP